MEQDSIDKTKQNLALLLKWYRLKRVNEFAARCDEEKAWQKIQRRIDLHRRRRRMLWIGSMAAAVAVVAVIGSLYSPHAEADQPSLFARKGEEKAVLLKEGKAYSLTKQDETRYAQATRTEEGQPQELVLSTPKGGEYKVTLADGTQVHANADSRLTYPDDFRGGKREVALAGEALFDVARDSLHPFVVHTSQGIVEVTGTRFNVNTYDPYRTLITLEEGTVEVKTATGTATLHPGEQAIVEGNGITRRKVATQEYTSWASGIYEYSRTPLEDIVSQLSRWYDVEMVFASPELKQRRFAGAIFRHQSLQKAVDILSKVSDVSFTQKGNIIEIAETNNQTNR